MPKSTFHSLTGWQALQPAIYLISLFPLLWVLTWPSSSSQKMIIFLAGAGVVLLQHAVNVFNDSNDWRRGADSEKWKSWVRYHDFSQLKVTLHGTLSLVAGVALGGFALYSANQLWILLLALPWVALGLLYNLGPFPFAYSRAGEAVTAGCYGVGVFGCLWCLLPSKNIGLAVFGVLGCAALASAVLLAHQPPQILNDAVAGKKTYAVFYGPEKTYRRGRLFFKIAMLLLAATFLITPAPWFVQAALALAASALPFSPQIKDRPRDYLTFATLPLVGFHFFNFFVAFFGGQK